MTALTFGMFVGFVVATVVAPAVDQWRRKRRRVRAEADRCGRIVVEPRRINQVRRDPSPVPRRRQAV